MLTGHALHPMASLERWQFWINLGDWEKSKEKYFLLPVACLWVSSDLYQLYSWCKSKERKWAEWVQNEEIGSWYKSLLPGSTPRPTCLPIYGRPFRSFGCVCHAASHLQESLGSVQQWPSFHTAIKVLALSECKFQQHKAYIGLISNSPVKKLQ